jgi:hypothetical protein
MERRIRYAAKMSELLHPELDATVLRPGLEATEEAICAEFARLAYRRYEKPGADRTHVEATVAIVGFTETAFFSVAGSQAFGACNPGDGRVIVSFRGTQADDVRDLITDARFVPVPWRKGGEAHGGFAKAAEELLAAGLEAWLRARADRDRIYAGHSLGAALAALAATVEMPRRLLTFGSPRVGDARFAATLGGIDCRRYVNCCDVVTQLPPPFAGYRHAGTLRYIDRLGVLSGLSSDDDIAHDQVLARLDYVREHVFAPGDVPLRDLADHAPGNYVYALFGIAA